MSDMLTVVGTNGGIEEKPTGWFVVSVLVPGKQYPVKLETKRTALIDAVRSTQGGVSTFTYTEKESDRINERTQRPYTNRYLEAVELGGQTQLPTGNTGSGGAAAPAGGNSEPVDWDAKERRDYRSRAWAQTISAFAHTIRADEPPDAVFGRLWGFQKMVYQDIVRDLAEDHPSQQRAAAPAQQAQQAQPQYDEAPPPPYEDPDDIPF